MKVITADEIKKWRVEIDNAEKFRDDEFGTNRYNDTSKAGENISYYDYGVRSGVAELSKETGGMVLINIIYAIIKNVIPTLYYKNPYVVTFPKRKSEQDEVSAPYAGALLNYFHQELELKNVNKQIVFDAYLLGMGVCKIGYTTKFGSVPTEEGIKEEKKQREKDKERGLLEKLGLRKPKKDDEENKNPELNEYIRSESPYVVWVNPFEFGIDPRATSIENAQYVYQKVTKRLDEVKRSKYYKNTSLLEGSLSDELDAKDVPSPELDAFKTIELYEVHYKADDGIYILTLAKDGKNYQALRHEKSIYEIDGFQYEVLYFNKHNHRLYPKSDIDQISAIQDRINITMENILDQVDKYVPKIFVKEAGVTEGGQRNLKDGEIGGIVYTNEDPSKVVKEANFIQLKADLVALIDKLLEVVMLTTGLTKAQLMGLTQAETATEAQIGQAGQNLRLGDKFDAVSDYLNKQSRKLWQVIAQFVDLEEISLITGEAGLDDATGLPKYSWLPEITDNLAENIAKGEYRFEIEVGSTEKPDLPILRKQVENMVNILGGPGVLQMIAQQGYKIELVEIFREYLKLFPNMFKNPGRIIKPIQSPMQAGIAPPPPGGQAGSAGANPQQLQSKPPNTADIISSIGGEKGDIPLA